MRLRRIEALVVGMKKSGVASVELLAREGARVRATDLKPVEELPEARLVLERLGIPFAQQTPAVFERSDLIVLSPDVPLDLAPVVEARRRGARVTGLDLAEAFLAEARVDALRRGVEVEYVVGDMQAIPWRARFDVVLNWFTAFG